ncbi:hypothetical protein KUCAC02_002419, partial [Chaenocephalus aceratus]
RAPLCQQYKVVIEGWAPNEVITVPETEVTLTFDPYPSRRCNVNNSSRHLPGGVRAPLSLIGWWHAELSSERPVCVKIKARPWWDGQAG